MPENPHPGLGMRLKEALKHSGHTMKNVCDIAGISLTTYQRYTHEEVSPTLVNVQRLAKAMRVDFTWLVTGEGDIAAFNPSEKERLLIRDLICDGLQQIEAAEKVQQKKVSAQTKANILSDLVTDALKEGERQVDETNVVRFLRYAGGDR